MRDPKRLKIYLDSESRLKLEYIEYVLKEQLLNKDFKTVWSHGDYKLENILFDFKSNNITGIIDWDLSRREGLPLIDIIYLLLYRHFTLAEVAVTEISHDRFLRLEFTEWEKKIILFYLDTVKLSEQFLKPLLIMFWLNHVTQRFGQRLQSNSQVSKDWLEKEIKPGIANIVNLCRIIKDHYCLTLPVEQSAISMQ